MLFYLLMFFTDNFMDLFNINEINQIKLTVPDYEYVKPLIDRFTEIRINYNEKKKTLREILKVQNNKKEPPSFIKKIFGSKNDESLSFEIADKIELEKEIAILKSQKDAIYYELKILIGKLVGQNKNYEKLYMQYLDCMSYINDVGSNYNYHLKLVERKKKIDYFFDQLKNDIEINKKMTEDEIKYYSENYKNIILFLTRLYKEQRGAKELNQNETQIPPFEFSKELDLTDTYTVLSVISILYSTMINPVYHNYKDSYLQYKVRRRFAKKYNNKIIELTHQALSFSKLESSELEL